MKLSTYSKSYFKILLYSLVVTGLIFWLIRFDCSGIDDANIYMVYMRNFANGHGFVYNVGAERVEGFSSILWTLIGAFFFWIGKNPGACLIIFNLLAISYTLTSTCIFINKYFNNKNFFSYQVIIFLALLIALPGYFDWSITSLMETGLWSSLLILISLDILGFEPSLQSNFDVKFAAMLALLVLCRPEATLWGSFFLMSRGVQLYLSNLSLKKVIFPSAIFLLTISVLTCWRLFYFWYPFPNTFYAKVSDDALENISEGAIYVKDYFKDNVLMLFVNLAGLKFFLESLKIFANRFQSNKESLHRTFQILFIFCISLVTFLVPLLTGGDHFIFYRFIQPTVPLMLILFLFLLKFYEFKEYKNWWALITFFALVTSRDNILHSLRTKIYPFGWEYIAKEYGKNEAKQLNIFFSSCPTYPTQGIFAAGGAAFFYKGKSIDLLGLNNVKMAHADNIKDTSRPKDHASFNKEVFFEQAPDIIRAAVGFINTNELNDTFYMSRLCHLFLNNVEEDELFVKRYSRCFIIKKGASQGFETFASSNFINSLDTNYFFVKRNFKFVKYQ